MAISKEMKDYINRKFDEKIRAVEEERRVAYNAANDKYKEAIRKKAQPVIDHIAGQLRDALATYPIIFENVYSSFQDKLLKFYVKDMKHDEIDTPFNERIAKLQKDREILLIRLSMEKDFMRINEALREYGIALD